MLRKLQIKNFKSLRNVQIDLGLRNILIGPNMAGKSNLIDVFRFLSQMVQPASGTYGLPNAIQTLGGFTELSWKGGASNVITIAAEGDSVAGVFDDEFVTWRYELSIVGNQWGSAIVQDESLTASNSKGIFKLIDQKAGQRVLRNPDGNELSVVGDISRSGLEFEIPSWRGSALRGYFGLFRFYGLVPVLMKQINQTIAAKFLSERGDNLSSWLMTLQTSHKESFARIDGAMRRVFPDVESIFTLPTQQATVQIASSEKYLKRPIPGWQMSDGELSFLALLSLIFCPQSLASPFICVEEPETNLHPRLIESLVAVLRQVQGELPPEQRAQIVITTHSPHLVDQCDLEELIVIEKKEGATVCTRPCDKKHLRELLQNEETGLGELYYSGALGSA
jgi:predicted ATPase